MMTMETIELLRNLYSAGGGAAHPSAVSAAIFGLLWNVAWKDAVAAGQSAHDSGADDLETSRVFHATFAESLGWTQGAVRRVLAPPW